MNEIKRPEPITHARLLRRREPYAAQRPLASRHSNYPRPAQPNTRQPNQITRPPVTNSTKEYWLAAQKQYLNRQKTGSSLTNLSLGRIR